MGRYKAYLEYKDSNIEMFGQIPSSWKAKQVRYLLKDGAEGIKIGPFGSALKLEDMVDDGIRVYGQENVIQRDFSLGSRRISELKFSEMTVYKVIENDILITMMGTSGKCIIVPKTAEIGIIDSHLLRVRVKENEILPSFFRLLIDESPEIANQIKIAGKGSIMHGLNSSIVKSLRLPLPSVTEQISILQFLDHETAKIDTLIEKQQQLVQLLKEKLQAVISHAVTKGLNPDAPMKDSGVEWLGQVPAHWEVTRAKYVSEIFVPQRNKPELNEESGTPWATMEDMKNSYIESTNYYVSDDAAKFSGSKKLRAGSVIASCVGNFGIASINLVDLIINQQLQAFVPKKIKAGFLREIVSISKSYFELIGTAATLVYVNQQGFENLPVIVPPLSEQEDICTFLEAETIKFDSLIKKAEKAIILMQERRTALISAAVTGKIDVRNWQAPTN
jgi:type I restriction enzyme S subunit